MSHVPETFVAEHKEEIERMAFQYHKIMQDHGRPDDPVHNFLTAANIVYGHYKQAKDGSYERIDR